MKKENAMHSVNHTREPEKLELKIQCVIFGLTYDFYIGESLIYCLKIIITRVYSR